MALEIERKYLVNFDLLPKLENGLKIKQGYLSVNEKGVVRARIKANKAYLTIKSANNGISRLEYEYEIPLNEADEMLNNLALDSIIDKTRYLIKNENHTWELDIFHGGNEGLIVAEIELNSIDEKFSLPSWVKEEVSEDIRYYNSNLMSNPYSKWKDK